MGPGPGAPRLQPAPNFPQLQAHLSRREGGPALGGAREAAGASSCRGAPLCLPAARPTARPGRLGLPHLPPGPSATRSPPGAPPASTPRSWGPAPAPGWARAATSSAEGVPRTVSCPRPGALPCLGLSLSPAAAAAAPRSSREGPRPDPAADRSALPLGRPGAEPGPLLSAATPARAAAAGAGLHERAGGGGGPRRPQIPGLAYRARRPTRARARAAAGVAGPASRRRTKAKEGAGGLRSGREVGTRSAGGHSGAARRAGGCRNRWYPGPASGPLIRIGSVRISSDRCKHTSETACFLARFARRGSGAGGGGGPGGWVRGRAGSGGGDEEGAGGWGGGVPVPRRPASSNQRPGWRAGVNQGTPRGLRRPPPRQAAEGGLRHEGRSGRGRSPGPRLL